MSLKFYNTLTRKKESFVPINKNKVKMYTCGPTVYNYAHLGNHRSYIFADILKRTLLYFKLRVKHIMNITDVDDKTIAGSQKARKRLSEFTKIYINEFIKEIKLLNILKPNNFVKATDIILEIVSLIKKLIKNKLAYVSTDGSIYFSIDKFKNYGLLSRINLNDIKKNAIGRIKSDEYSKDNAEDFALWKAWDKNDGNIFWKTELGKGRPGWHIECSAIVIKSLGEQIDIHTGGVDLIFPHHENEIAQSEGITKKKFVKYWLHNEHLLVNGEKMAKSSGNFYNLNDLIKIGIDPLSYRFWLLMSHYRTKTNFTLKSVKAAKRALEKLYIFYNKLNGKNGKINSNYKKKFEKCLEDDLNTPRALSVLWSLVKDNSVKATDKKVTLRDFDKVLGLNLESESRKISMKYIKKKIEKIPNQIKMLVQEREIARKEGDFIKADLIREQIKSLGYEIQDAKSGPTISLGKIS